MRTELFIRNEFGPAEGGATMPVVNPATEEIVAQVAAGGAVDIDRAVTAARATFESDAWQGLSARARGRVLLKLADLIEANIGELAKLETLHNGKTLFESKIEVSMSAEVFRFYGGLADKIAGETLPVNGNFFVYTLREPVGVVGAIVPWNFPLNLASWKVAAALAAGCTVVLKPAETTPLTALALADLAVQAGLPAGALNVVPGFGETAGAALVKHPGVDKVAFTGSTEVGRLIMSECAKTNKRVTLELGGKSPNIVFDDADVEAAIRGAQTGIFYGKGEVCAAGSRLLVSEKLHDEVVEKLAARAKKLTPGDPFEKTTRMGAIASKAQLDRVLGYVAAGKAEGAELVSGGAATSHNGKGYFMEATVFAGVTPEMKIAREEIFGPVLAVMKFADVDEAVALANRTDFGLAAGIWTRDIAKAHNVAKRIRAGTVWINTYNFFDTAAPFGGYKASGFGRDLGAEALNGYLETKTVWVGLD
jgi:aldehyde dehydrogenase (NAD+)